MDQADTQTASEGDSDTAMEEMDNNAMNDDPLANNDDGTGGSGGSEQEDGSVEG